jgi:hypothetical protein
MVLKPLGEWSPWRIAIVALGWIAAVLGYMAIRTALAGLPANDGLDTYYIVVHLHYPKLTFLGPPLLLTALWLWQRRASRSAG